MADEQELVFFMDEAADEEAVKRYVEASLLFGRAGLVVGDAVSLARLVELDLVQGEHFQNLIDMAAANISSKIVIEAVDAAMLKLPMYEYKLAPKLELNDGWRHETKAQRRRRLGR